MSDWAGELELLYRRCARVVGRWAWRRGFPKEAVEDAIQTAVFRWWQASQLGRRVDAPLAWVCTVARRELLSEGRRSRGAQGAARETSGDHRARKGPPDPSDALLSVEAMRWARDRLEALPSPYRQVCLARYFWGLSYAETVAWLSSWWRVGAERSRQLVAESKALAKRALSAAPPLGGRRVRRWVAPPEVPPPGGGTGGGGLTTVRHRRGRP